MNTNNFMNFKTEFNKLKFFILFVFTSLCYSTSSAQTNSVKLTDVQHIPVLTPSQDKEIVSMDFAIWFMGSIHNSEPSIKIKSFSKKQLINSGVITNSVLIRSFLKKISNQESSIS